MQKRLRLISAIAILLLGTVLASRCAMDYLRGPVPVGQPTPVPEGEGWIDLLDTDFAAGWENITDEKDIFSIEEGVLHIHGRSLLTLRYVGYTPRAFSDFDLHLEFKLAPRANSGVFLRAQRDDPVYRGFEVQVLDDHGKRPSKRGSGAIYDVVTPMFNLARPAGEWNSYDIALRGTHVVVALNGWKVIDTDLALMEQPLGKFDVPYAELPRAGLLALQDHGGQVWYRNVRIRPAGESREVADD